MPLVGCSNRHIGLHLPGYIRIQPDTSVFDSFVSGFGSLGFSSTHPPSTLCRIRMVRGEERVKRIRNIPPEPHLWLLWLSNPHCCRACIVQLSLLCDIPTWHSAGPWRCHQIHSVIVKLMSWLRLPSFPMLAFSRSTLSREGFTVWYKDSQQGGKSETFS